MSDINPVYFDSALIAKFYLNEPGQDHVRKLASDAGEVLSSAIAMIEVTAAFHRKLRENAINSARFKSLCGQFAIDVENNLWSFVPVSDALLDDGRALFNQLNSSIFLRSLDALHLVTARSEQFKQLYTNDRRLLEACPATGLRGINPLI